MEEKGKNKTRRKGNVIGSLEYIPRTLSMDSILKSYKPLGYCKKMLGMEEWPNLEPSILKILHVGPKRRMQGFMLTP